MLGPGLKHLYKIFNEFLSWLFGFMISLDPHAPSATQRSDFCTYFVFRSMLDVGRCFSKDGSYDLNLLQNSSWFQSLSMQF